ncbi:MAG TPA: DUF2905 domain-containing protein [Firmicutes bacterium]|nr:DUF2905 domain-containing protein [Bacillota bacterium]
MFGFDNIGKTLLVLGGIIALVGLFFLLLGRTGLGRLPGDILIKRENLTIFFPITTMIVISILLSLFFNLLRRF